MLICLNFFFLFVLIPACGDVALSFDACNEGGVTPASDEIVTNPASANELCFLQIHGALCMTEDEVLSDCEWVLKSQKVYISWCRWLHKSFCWHWHSCFACLWPQDRKWHSPWWPCFSSVNDFAISFVEQTQVLVTTTSFLLRCFSCTCFSLINYSTRGVRRREKHCSYSSIEGHQWLHRSRTAQACMYLWKGSMGRARCEYTTQHCYFLLVWSRSLTCRRSWTTCLSSRVCFSESLKQSCLHFPLSGFHACIFLSRVFITGATVNLTQDDVVLNSVVTTECDRTLEKTTRRRVNCLPWLDSLLLRQTEHSSRFFARPNMFALQTSLEKALYTTGVSDASVIPTATRKFIRLRKLTDKSTSLWSMPTLWVRDTAEFISFFWTWFLMGQNFDLVASVLVRIAFYECVARYSAEQRHVSQLRGDTSDLVIDDKEVTIFRTSSAGSWRRIRR